MKFNRLLVALTILCLCAGHALADEKEDPLKKRFEQRIADIRIAKDAGKIGETAGGLLEAVDKKNSSDAKLKKLVEEENTDRQKVYAMIADQEKVEAAVVAERAGKRNFDKAKTGDFLKGADGKWTQKK